jgi:competence protein ComEC
MKKYSIHWYIVIGFVLINAFIWSFAVSSQSHDIMKVYFLDIGQGDSIFVVAPNGRSILIDGGPDSSVLRELGKVLGFFHRSIDIVLATHPDQDHIAGLPLVMDRYHVSTFIDSIADSSTASYQTLERTAKEKGITTYFGMRGMTIVLDHIHGVYLELLYPVADDFKLRETNDLSAVAKLVYGDTSVMLTGDATKLVENMLDSTDGAYLPSTILKAGHHGSDTSSSRVFVDAVHPKYAIISAGIHNKYGHPKAVTMKTLADAGATILETAKEGTIEFASNGVDIWQK